MNSPAKQHPEYTLQDLERAACQLAVIANSLVLDEKNRSSYTPNQYRKTIKAVRALTWCAINDAGVAKRAAVRKRGQDKA